MSVYKRGRIWWIRFQAAGITIRQSSRSRSRRVAEGFEVELREEHACLRRGGKPRMTFDDMMARFVREHFPTLRPSAGDRYAVSIKALRRHFGGVPLDGIGRGALSDFVTARRKEVTTTTVRRDLACLSSACEDAIGWDWLDANPIKAFSRRALPEGKPRTRYLTGEEYDRLIAGAVPHTAALIRFAVATGLRKEEQLGLVWTAVDLARKEARLDSTKRAHPGPCR